MSGSLPSSSTSTHRPKLRGSTPVTPFAPHLRRSRAVAHRPGREQLKHDARREPRRGARACGGELRPSGRAGCKARHRLPSVARAPRAPGRLGRLGLFLLGRPPLPRRRARRCVGGGGGMLVALGHTWPRRRARRAAAVFRQASAAASCPFQCEDAVAPPWPCG